MLKLFSLLTKFLFIANYGLCSIAFIYFLNWFDTGEWISDGWIFSLIGGLISGALALIFELNLYRKLEFWPKSLWLFLARHVTCGIGFMILGWVIASSITIVKYFFHNPSDVAMFIVIPFAVAIYLPLLAPFGVVAGLTNGVLFRIAYTIQNAKRLGVNL